MQPKIDRLAYADCAHVEDELRARERGEEFLPPFTRTDESNAPCSSCGRCRGAADVEASATSQLSRGELDALHFRFWSADRKRFDHIGFALAVLAARARKASQSRA